MKMEHWIPETEKKDGGLFRAIYINFETNEVVMGYHKDEAQRSYGFWEITSDGKLQVTLTKKGYLDNTSGPFVYDDHPEITKVVGDYISYLEGLLTGKSD